MLNDHDKFGYFLPPPYLTEYYPNGRSSVSITGMQTHAPRNAILLSHDKSSHPRTNARIELPIEAHITHVYNVTIKPIHARLLLVTAVHDVQIKNED